MRRSGKSAIYLLILSAGVVALLVACAASRPDDAGGSWQAKVYAYLGAKADLPPDIVEIELLVNGPGMALIRKSLWVADLADDEEVSFLVYLTAGQRLFEVNCLTADGFGLYRGSRTVQVSTADLDLTINLEAYGTIEGRITYLDGAPLADYQEIAFETEIETGAEGYYHLEMPLGETIIEVQPELSLASFTRVLLTEPGELALADLVLIPTADTTQPWISAVSPSRQIAGGQTVGVFGRGFQSGTELTVWFGQPETMIEAEILGVGSDNDLQAVVPADAPATGLVAVCWTGNQDCSNLFPYALVQ